jgi:hypothetical protein
VAVARRGPHAVALRKAIPFPLVALKNFAAKEFVIILALAFAFRLIASSDEWSPLKSCISKA